MEMKFTKIVLASKLEKDIYASIPDIDYIVTKGSDVSIFFTRTLTAPEQTTVTNIVNAHVPSYPELKADSLGINHGNALITDFSIILNKAASTFEKGRRIKAQYYLTENHTDLAVERLFSDELDVNGKLVKIIETVNWYDADNNVAITKTINHIKNQYQAGKVLKDRRSKQVDYWVEGAKGTPAEPLVTAIFEHYASQVNEYIAIGNNVLLDAINNETDPTILGYLNTVVLPPSTTMKDSILAQIT